MDIETELRLARERIRQLSESNEYLREQIRAERDRLAPFRAFPVEWGLTRNETLIFSALISRDVVTRDNLMAVVYPPHVRDEMVDKNIEVYICKIRAKLKPHGIEIYTRWGMGWHVDPKVRARLKSELAEAA
jgi:DNA-binding response OmpR family regulator